MKISIVTPSFNRPDYLDETIASVLSQSGNFDLEYIIQDGGSSAEVTDIIKRWEKRVSTGNFTPTCRSLSFKAFVESDSGMYDALNRGFSRATGDIFAWLNSDDYYVQNALRAVHLAFDQYPLVQWIIGRATCFNKEGSIVQFGYDPTAYSSEFVRRGYYRGDVPGFNWLSQDACFWTRALWEKSGGLDSSLKLVGDFRLWQAFSKHTDLVSIDLVTGGYRFHGNQLTGNLTSYPNELGSPPKLPLRLKVLLIVSNRLRGFGKFVCSRIHPALCRLLFGIDQNWLVGRKLRWSFKEDCWKLLSERILP